MSPSVNSSFILQMFSNTPIKSSFSKCSSWKLQLYRETECKKSKGWSREFMEVAGRHSWEAAFSICLWDYAKKPNPLDFPSYLMVFLYNRQAHHLPCFSHLLPVPPHQPLLLSLPRATPFPSNLQGSLTDRNSCRWSWNDILLLE